MAVAAWAASTAFSAGDIRRAATDQVTGLFFKCTTAGDSGTSEPKWPTDIGSTVADGTVTWTAISSLYEDLSSLTPNTIIQLFELHLDSDLHGSSTIYRWHNENTSANITWDGQNYLSEPIKAEGFEYKSGQQTLPRPMLTISNANLSVTSLLLLVNATTPGNDLGGAKVVRIRTCKKYLDGESAADPHAKRPDEIWYVDRKQNEDRFSATFELASEFDKPGQKIPKRQVIANICQWAYRSSECGYTGSDYFDVNDNPLTGADDILANDKCGKRLSSCKKRFSNDLPFGSYPGSGSIR